MDLIGDYLNTILSTRLKNIRIPTASINAICDNIRNQMQSLLYHWNEDELKKTILLLGAEEGYFYRPKANLDIKCFVVVTIRNSLLETACSIDSKELGCSEAIDDSEIIKITTDAINYFKNINFAEEKISLPKKDIYGTLKSKYPVAWEALYNLANIDKKRIKYQAINLSNDDIMDELNNDILMKKENFSVTGGYNPNLDPALISSLKMVAMYKSPFCVDSFKVLTRNVEKLFRIINYILSHGSAFVTVNYLITNGYIERRKPIIRAAHGRDGIKSNMCNFRNLSKTHADILKEVLHNSVL